MAKKKKEEKVYDYKEEFNKIDRAVYENNQARVILQELLEKNQDNEALMEYIALRDKIDANNIIVDESKKNMFQGMEDSGVDILEGVAVSVSIKHSYIKKELDRDRLKEELGEEKYNSYMIEKSVKGNVIINIKEQ